MLSSFLERIAHFFTCFVDFLLNVFTEVLNLVFPLVDNFLAVFGELFELFIEFVELLIELFLYDHEQAYACQECWAIDFVDNLLYLKWQEAVKDVWEVRDPYEEQLFSERDSIDREALQLYKKKPEKALEFLTGYSQGKMEEVLDMYNDLHDRLIVKYTLHQTEITGSQNKG